MNKIIEATERKEVQVKIEDVSFVISDMNILYIVRKEMCTSTSHYHLISGNIELEVSRKVREMQGGSPVLIRVQ